MRKVVRIPQCRQKSMNQKASPDAAVFAATKGTKNSWHGAERVAKTLGGLRKAMHLKESEALMQESRNTL